MSDCPHGMPTPASCLDCMTDEGLGVERPEPESVAATFAARYDGHCPECNLPITTGVTIAKLEPSGRYVHAGCAP